MPSSTVQSFVDPWEFHSSIRDSNVETFVTGRGAYRSKLTKMELHRIGMQRAEVVLPQVTHSVVKKDVNTIYFLSDVHQPSIFTNGMELSPGVLVVSPPEATHHRRFSDAGRWGSIALKPDDLAAAGHALLGRDLVAPPEIRLIRPPPHLMERLLNLHDAAGQLAATAPDILAHPEVCRAMDQELVHVMVRCLAEDLVGPEKPQHQRQPVMRRFEQFLKDNPDDPIYLPEVCAALRVSDRTLRTHCEEHLGMGPHRYLWLRRMNHVRRALTEADPASTTVTTIALDHGFGELGRFAVMYRELFGESPSMTLRSTRDTD